MSMFVGAVMPRQKTAFALGGLKASAATKDVTATQLKRNMRITEFTGFSTRFWAVHSYYCSTSSSAPGVVRIRRSNLPSRRMGPQNSRLAKTVTT
jgi:hypothetical protein